MGDMGDDFRFWKEVSKEKRAANRENSARILARSGVLFDSHNRGAHLVVRGPNGLIDFWPGTGRWTERTGPKAPNGRGVRSLLKHMGRRLCQ